MKTKTYRLGAGTVQPFVACDDPCFMFHFGMAEYDRSNPVLTESVKQKAQPIVDALNAGTMTTQQAKEQLSKIFF